MSRWSVLVFLAFTGCPDKDTGDTDVDTGDEDTDTDPDMGTGTDIDDDSDTGDVDVDFPGYATDSLHNQSLSHEQGSCTSSAFDQVIPEEGFEHLHWAAVRLQANEASTPFEVDAVSVELLDDPSLFGCRATTARDILVFKQAGGDPPLRPTEGAQAYTVMPQDVLQRTYMRQVLDTSITLNTGDDLWVMVQVESTSDGRTCIRACTDGPQEDNNWFSTSAMEPIGWQQLHRFSGISAPTNMLIEAYDLP